jgi:aspartate kinase
MIVMKFGGATVQDAPCIENISRIVGNHLSRRPVIVVSAVGKTTQALLDSAVLASSGSSAASELALDRIRSTHHAVARTLIPDWESSDGFRKLGSYFSDLNKLLNGISILRELSPQSQDKVLSYGELIATALITEAFARRNIPAALLDSRELMVTDDRFTLAAPIKEIAYGRIRAAVLDLVERGRVPVLQGYIGSTRGGVTTTLGFEGSDYTAALTGAAADAAEIQIWKEVPGMMTADPDIVPRALKVKAVSYDEASELTFLGAKVLHPKAVEPAVMKKIPIRVLCTRNPDSTGTLITERAMECRNPVKSVAYKKPIQSLRIRSGFSAGDPAVDEIWNSVRRYGVSPVVTAVSGSSLVMTFSPVQRTESLLEDLRKFGEPELTSGLASVSLVGSGLRNRKETVETLIRQISDSGLQIVHYGASPISCSLVVEESLMPALVNRLHDFFFSRPDPEVFE